MSILKPDFVKEGPGVGKDVSADPGFIRFFKVIWARFGQIVILNIVYIFACLPIVTIGPATAGLTYVMRNMSQSKPVFFMSDFLDKARTSFKQAFFVTLIDALGAVLIYFSFMFWSDASIDIPSFFRPVSLVVTFILAYLLICINYYIFPMMVSFDLPLKKLFKNSAILAMYKIGHNIAMILFTAVCFVGCYFLGLLSVPLILFLIFSIGNLFNNFITFPLLVKYVAAPAGTSPETPADDKVFSDERRL